VKPRNAKREDSISGDACHFDDVKSNRMEYADLSEPTHIVVVRFMSMRFDIFAWVVYAFY